MDRGRKKRKEERKKLERRKINGNPSGEDAFWVKKRDAGGVLDVVSLMPK